MEQYCKPNTRSHAPIIIEDLYPTLLSMAGIKNYHVPQKTDGQDITPILRGKQQGDKKRQLIWNYPNIWDGEGLGISLNCAIREGQWKLILFVSHWSKRTIQSIQRPV